MKGKGRGQTITDLHLTEPPFWRGDAQKALQRRCSKQQGGEVAVESTAFGIDWFHSIYQPGQETRGRLDEFLFRVVVEAIVPNRGCAVRPGTKERMDPSAPGRNAERRLANSQAGEISEAKRVAKRNRFDRAKVSKEEQRFAS
jgi:hypothetical protein